MQSVWCYLLLWTPKKKTMTDAKSSFMTWAALIQDVQDRFNCHQEECKYKFVDLLETNIAFALQDAYKVNRYEVGGLLKGKEFRPSIPSHCSECHTVSVMASNLGLMRQCGCKKWFCEDHYVQHHCDGRDFFVKQNVMTCNKTSCRTKFKQLLPDPAQRKCLAHLELFTLGRWGRLQPHFKGPGSKYDLDKFPFHCTRRGCHEMMLFKEEYLCDYCWKYLCPAHVSEHEAQHSPEARKRQIHNVLLTLELSPDELNKRPKREV